MTKNVDASCRSEGFTFQSSFHICFASADEKDNWGILLQPLRWCCVDYVIHHERDVREE